MEQYQRGDITEVTDSQGVPTGVCIVRSQLFAHSAVSHSPAVSSQNVVLRPLYNKDQQPIMNVDSATFRYVGDRFFVDASSIYIEPDKNARWVIYPHQSGSIRYLNRWYAFDEQYLYCRLRGTRRAIDGALVALSDKNNAEYAFDDQHVYFFGKRIKGADKASFAKVANAKEQFFRDKSYVYFYGKRIDGADPETFVEVNSFFADAIDKHRAYCGPNEVTALSVLQDRFADFIAAQTDSAQQASPYHWLKTLLHAERCNEEVQAPSHDDLNTAEPDDSTTMLNLGDGFGECNGDIYFADSKLLGYRKEDFSYLGAGFFIHQGAVYWQETEIYLASFSPVKLAKADAREFRHSGGRYFVDGKGVYCAGKLLRKADLASFQVWSDRLATDNQHVFYDGRCLTKVSVDGFAYLHGEYFAVNAQLHYRDKLCKRLTKQVFVQGQTREISAECIANAEGKVAYYGVPLNNKVDGHSLEFFEHSRFAKDNKQVYVVNYFANSLIPLPQADVTKFHLTGKKTGSDGVQQFDADDYLPTY
uniref:DKNYY domain-containing protein n=1 Tax=Thaumasiovibrio occultus TaxID=1891184 RepID=UPI000B3567A2|nr:DKNYY domain-containing protein [Thaumasiovibrio occultus]